MAAHFEIHVNDLTQAKAFYEGLLGWTFEAMPGGEEVEYHLVTGDGIGEGHDLTGGLMRRMDESPAKGAPIRGATLVLPVDDVDARYEWALENGGAEALPPTDYPGIGRAAYCEDGQGNVVGLITPAEGED